MLGKKLTIKELKPGMVLFGDIYCPQTGVLLLKAGTVLREAILFPLQKNNPHLYCYVYDTLKNGKVSSAKNDIQIAPAQSGDFGQELSAEQDWTNLELPQASELIDRETAEIYSRACRTLHTIYSNRKIKPYLGELYAVVDNLVGKLLRHPDMLIYAVLLKRVDNFTFCHAVNVSVFSLFLGHLTGLKENELRELALAGILHDIGKLDIPAEIWNKKGYLTDWEFKRVQEHSLHGYFRLSNEVDKVDRQSLVGVLQHHERLDGSGYPHGLKEDELHLWSRILAICDVFDAYTSERIYRKAHPHHEGLEFLWRNSARFDKSLLRLFIRNLSFFPIGSRVLLNTGEKGIIMGINKHAPHRPIIRVNKKDGTGEKLVDLIKDSSIYIEKLI